MNAAELNSYLATIVDSTDDAIVSKDLNGIVKSFNRAAERMFGYRADEIIGRSIETLIPPERRSEEPEILAKLRRGERVVHFETVRMRKDGSLLDVSLTVSPIRDEHGVIVAASKVARDITEQKRRALATAQLAAIVESSDDAIIGKDLNGIMLSFNRAAERMFGYRADEAVGRSVTLLIPPDRQNEETEILGRLRRGEKIDHYETVRMRKDGGMVDVSLSVSPVRDAHGRVVGASKVARDITERKRAQAEMAVQQEWFRITLNSIGDAVIACDSAGRVTFLNHEAERLTGWTLADAQGADLAEVFHIVNESSRQRVESPAALVLRLGHTVGLANHTVLLARDGTEHPIADSAAPIVGPDGKTLGVVLVFRDITEARSLERRGFVVAAERERLLESERAARNEAERANRVKDDFVAMVSHELRSPLNAILGWTELLKRPGQDPALLAQGIEVIARNTRLQTKLISDLLDVSRIVSGKLQLERERVDLVRVVNDSVDALRAELVGKDVRLTVQVPPTPLEVLGDAARLQQILLNLLSNAGKFTPEGGRIAVTLSRVGEQARIVVTDTGVGIPPEVLPGLFERFRQASSLTTRRYGGLGLGLSITRHLVELHGGTVQAHSAGEGQGAKFTLELPLLTSTAVATAAAESADATALAGLSLAGIRVLVVEDHQDTRDLIRRLLESFGASVVNAASAAEALDLLATERPDILLSDIGLPDVDGYELIRRVRSRSDALARIPAVALTAFARSVDRRMALSAGFHAHISKPVEAAELAVTIASLNRLVSR